MIQINDITRIVKIDENNLAIEELKTVTTRQNKTRQEWCRRGYYGSLRSAMVGVLEKNLFNCADEKLTLQELVNKIDIIIQEIKDGQYIR